MQKTPSDIVVRPSGVWDTRAPLYYFIALHQRENEIYHALTMGINYLMNETKQWDINDDAKDMLVNKVKGNTQERAMKSYGLSLPKNKNGEVRTPVIGDYQRSLENSRSPITEYAIISYFGLFETFIRCWALNYLLAKLENEDKDINDRWTPDERKLANLFSPIRGGQVPSFVKIYQSIPVIEDRLRRLPHIFNDPKTGNAITEPITPQLTAFQTIEFWRDWRNLLVHSSGIVDGDFVKDHKKFWEDFKNVFPAMSGFQKGHRLILNEWTFRAMTTVHYNAARSLRDVLVEVSRERRGHSDAPGPEATEKKRKEINLAQLPKLLIAGDHDSSYRWTIDKNFQKEWLNSYEKKPGLKKSG